MGHDYSQWSAMCSVSQYMLQGPGFASHSTEGNQLTLDDFSRSASIAAIFLRFLPSTLASTAAPLSMMEQGPWGVEGWVCNTQFSAYMPFVLGLNWKLHNKQQLN